MLMAFKAGQYLLRHFSINRHGGKGRGECGVERENGDHQSMQMCGVAALMCCKRHEAYSSAAYNSYRSIVSNWSLPSSKNAKVTPRCKKGERCNFSNYRPVFTLPVLSKMLEKTHS